jgi:hypothetical protein
VLSEHEKKKAERRRKEERLGDDDISKDWTINTRSVGK